jgi:hypothetical protein
MSQPPLDQFFTGTGPIATVAVLAFIGLIVEVAIRTSAGARSSPSGCSPSLSSSASRSSRSRDLGWIRLRPASG